jgi:Protein of unknown function (DUF3618)
VSAGEREAREEKPAAVRADPDAIEEVHDRAGTPGEQEDAEALRAEIRETREELGETVEALSEKADVKARAKAKVDEGKERLGEAQQEAKTKAGELGQRARERPVPLIAAVVLGLVLLWLIRRD